jgi:dipeptidyl aminopeptidase/acylaminoacyl peptidase
MVASGRGLRAMAAAVGLSIGLSSLAVRGQVPDFERLRRQQAQTDSAWQSAAAGYMRAEKITYRSRADDLDIPAFVFLPLQAGGARSRPALVWVHEDVRGHLYEHYIPYIREATRQGFIVIAPEYRGSIGYGSTLYDAIDYGGADVDDVVTAVNVLKTKYPEADPERVGVIGWSHGGLIALLATFRNPALFKAAVAIVPVTNLFQRLALRGVEKQRALIDPANRLGGPPSERHDVYRDRSPLYNVDRLRIPLLVHVCRNDEEVTIEESLPLVEALRVRKPALADTKIYDAPIGGHVFDRRVVWQTWQPANTPEQRDSWGRVWRFLDRNVLKSRFPPHVGQ